MTNTKFRKRALLSSVAMLLVALVALGSATFAWFSVRDDATATGLKGATAIDSTLTIKEMWADDWANDITFDGTGAQYNVQPAKINPVTFDGTDWNKAVSAGLNKGAMKSDGTLTPIANLTATDAAYSTVFVKYGEATDTTSSKDLYVTINLPEAGSGATAHANADKFVRVALIPVAGTTAADGEGGNSAAALGSSAFIVADALNSDYSADAANWKLDASGNAPATFTGKSAANQTFGTEFKLGQLTNGTAYKYRVVVYYEGTDPDCIENNAGQSINNFSFSFAVKNHSA